MLLDGIETLLSFLGVWGGHMCKTLKSSKARDSTGWDVNEGIGQVCLKWGTSVQVAEAKNYSQLC